MTLPLFFPSLGERALASYDFVDIAAGTGVQTFYGGIFLSGAEATSYTSTGAKHVLSSQKFYSDVVSATTGGVTSSTTSTKMLDLDWDVSFNLPRVMKGDVVVNLPIGFNDVNSANTYQIVPSIWVRKVEGTTETNIVNMSGSSFLSGGGATGVLTALTAFTGNVPLTTFKAGDKLRVTTELWCKTGTDPLANSRFFMGADPQGRTTTNRDNVEESFKSGDVTVFAVQIPFVIDL